jgi:hemerythrin-like metal-binding protein
MEEGWNARYELGVEVLDSEHRRLFDLVRRVRSVVESEGGSLALLSALQELTDFASLHFQTEEKLMEEHDFSTAGLHRKAHERLLQELREFSRRISRIPVSGVRASVEDFLGKWLVEHVSHGDAMLARHLKSEGY